MTNSDLINYYANLLILQYRGKPNAYAHIQALVTPVIMSQLPLAVQNAFSIDTATGVQLDTIGKYVGVTRTGYVGGTAITLSDSDFTSLIKLAIFRNNFGSALADIQNLLHEFFPNEIYVFDYKNMRMSYLINSSVGSQNLVRLFISEGLFPKPMGVQLALPIYAPVVNTFFGFRTYLAPAANVSPFNTYVSYNMSSPWVRYSNAISA